MNCPRCKTALNIEKIKEINFTVEVDKCPSCSGIWFDESELQRLENITEITPFERRRIPSEYKQLDALYCPKCEQGGKELMKKATHPKDHKVIMDYCENCKGIWLDGGELQAIQQESTFRALWTFLKNLHPS